MSNYNLKFIKITIEEISEDKFMEEFNKNQRRG